MTDRLSTLLHDEATHLDIPAAAPDRVLAQGRDIQRRRRTTTAISGAVAAVLVAAVALAAVSGWRDDDRLEPASPTDQAAYQELGAWAVGDEVHVGDHVTNVPDAVRIGYTSVGALVLSQTVEEKALVSTLTLVHPDGSESPVTASGTEQLAILPGTDPATSQIAFDRSAGDDQREIVVLDLVTGTETVLDDRWPDTTFGTNEIVTLSGDGVIYQDDKDLRQVDWRTGEALPLSMTGLVVRSGYGHGAYVSSTRDPASWEVRSTTDSSLLVRAPIHGGDDSFLSPDGRYFAASTGENGFRVYSVETGDSVEFGGDRDTGDYGWTPDGHLIGKEYRSQKSEVEVCDPDTGTCIGTGDVLADKMTLVEGSYGVTP